MMPTELRSRIRYIFNKPFMTPTMVLGPLWTLWTLAALLLAFTRKCTTLKSGISGEVFRGTHPKRNFNEVRI